MAMCNSANTSIDTAPLPPLTAMIIEISENNSPPKKQVVNLLLAPRRSKRDIFVASQLAYRNSRSGARSVMCWLMLYVVMRWRS